MTNNQRVYLECSCGFVFELPPITRKIYNMGKLFNDEIKCRKCQKTETAKIDKDRYEKKRREFYKECSGTVCNIKVQGVNKKE